MATGPRRCYIRWVPHSIGRTNPIRISFLPRAHEATIRHGQTALEAAQEAGTVLVAPCEGAGHCGKCVVRFLIHAPEPSPWDVLHLDPDALADGCRLACTARPGDDCIISVPRQPSQILIGEHSFPYRLSPPAQAAQITASDADVTEELRSILPVIALRETPRRLTLCSIGRELRTVELGWERTEHLGVAVSVHGETVEGTLHDLRDGRTLASATAGLIGDSGSLGSTATGITSATRRLVRTLCDDARVAPAAVADIVVLGMPSGTAEPDERLRCAGMGESPTVDAAAAAAIGSAPVNNAPLLLLGLEPYPWAQCSSGGSARIAIAPDVRLPQGSFVAPTQSSSQPMGAGHSSPQAVAMSARPHGLDLGMAVDMVVDLRRAGLLDRRGARKAPVDGSEPQDIGASRDVNADGGSREGLRQEHVRAVQRLRATLRMLRSAVLDGMGVYECDLQKVALVGAHAASLGYSSLAALDILQEVPAPLVRGFPDAAHVGVRLALLSTSAGAEIAALAHQSELITLTSSAPGWAEGLYLDLTDDDRALDGSVPALLDFPSPRRSVGDRPPAIR